MEVFECTGCKYRTNVKCNYIRHQSSEKHKKSEEKKNAKKEDQPTQELRCRYCTQLFTCKQSLQRHENHICKRGKKLTELEINLQAEVKDLKKLVKLLHLQLTQKDVLLDIKNDLIENLQKYNELKIN